MAEADVESLMREIKKLQVITAISTKSVLTDEEAEIYTGYTADHLYRERRSGKLACIKQGRCVRYVKADLDAWMMRDRVAPDCEIEERAARYIFKNPRATKG